jgi:hypothetical protein
MCFTVKPVGEPDAGDRHVRFDERGWETGRCRMAQATAPILDSTLIADQECPRGCPSAGEGRTYHDCILEPAIDQANLGIEHTLYPIGSTGKVATGIEDA